MHRSGPIDDGTWSEALCAHVVDADRRVHGYDVLRDLARHYSFAEVVLATLVGETPSEQVGRAFSLAMIALAPVGVAHGASHATSLGRMLGTPPRATIAIATGLLAESADELLTRHAPLFAWLDNAAGGPPAVALTDDPQALADARTVLEALGEDAAVCPCLVNWSFTRDAVVIALLHACGLRTPLLQTTALVMAMAPAVIAEATFHAPRSLREYPITLPPFQYREGDDDGG